MRKLLGLLSATCDRYLIGETTGGERVAGHTGGDSGSAIAVYHRLDQPTGTAAAFVAGGDDAAVKDACVTQPRARP